MSNQVQCPNCGGYKIGQEINRIDSTTGSKIGSGCRMFFLEIIVAVVLLGILVALTDNAGLLWLGALAILFLVILPLHIWYKIRKSQAQKRAYNLYKYQCNLCGYHWEWREGQSQPKVNVRPDLIAKGEQRLEEEGRKQQKDAAALYYLTHQGKK